MAKKSLLLLLILMLFCLAACGGQAEAPAPAPAPAEGDAPAEADAPDDTVYTIRLPHIENEFTASAQGCALFEEYVEEKSAGRIQVEVFPAGVITSSEREILEGVILETYEAGMVTASLLNNYLPDYGFLDLPYVFESREACWDLLDGDLGAFLKAQTPDIGVEVIAFPDCSVRCVTNNVRPVATVDDMKGLKIRVMETDVCISAFKAMGANPVPMSFGEIYTGLQQGTIDGQDAPVIMVKDGNFQEVQKYYTATDHMTTTMAVIISTDYMNSLPADLQQIIREGARECCEVQQRAIAVEVDEEAKDLMLEAGMEFTELTPEAFQGFRDACAPVVDEYRAVMSPELFEMAGI